MRGFDIFMRVANRILEYRSDVAFLIVGADRTNYGHEVPHLGGQTFKQWVLSQDNYDPSRFVFLDLISLADLTTLYNLTNLHIHLSVPYVPSPSLLQAMASGCAILGSATAPVQEFIEDGVHGRLAAFDDVQGLTERALEMLENPEQAQRLGQAARERVLERYELGRCLDQASKFFEEFDRRTQRIDEALAGF